jgi:CysZ protein
MIKYIRQFVNTIFTFWEVPDFIKENRLWKGFIEHKLVVMVLILAGGLFSLRIIGLTQDWWNHAEVHDPIEAGLQATYLVKNLAVGSYDYLFAGGYKYLILILMELVIFHMTLRTHAILNGSKVELTPGIFVKAQIRMIKVVIFTFVMELIVSIGIKIAFSLLGMDWLKAIFLFLNQCFFLGFAMVDNYNEIHNLEIRESFKHSLQYAGVAVGVGLVLYVLILIPLIGPFVGPLVAAIASTLIMHELDDHNPERVMT